MIFGVLIACVFIYRCKRVIKSLPPRSIAEDARTLSLLRRFVASDEWAKQVIASLRLSAARDESTASSIEFISDLSGILRAGRRLCDGSVKALGIDVEFSPRSFRGFVCLVQISVSGGPDYIFDVLVPEVRAALHAVLGPVFANPNVVKVFHGAGSDTRYLARDLGISIVGLVDTAVLAKILNYPLSLAALLSSRLNVQLLDKQVGQARDWRCRPLTAPALNYAARDSRHLIALAVDLISQLSLEAVVSALVKSAAIAARRDPDVVRSQVDAAQLLQSCGVQLSGSRALFSAAKRALESTILWREETASERDMAVEDIAPLAELAVACAAGVLAANDDPSAACVCAALSNDPRTFALNDAVATVVAREILSALSSTSSKQDAAYMRVRPTATREAAKAARAERVFTLRSKPLYSNCELLDPTGRVLARISKTKAEWYISVGAGTREPHSPQAEDYGGELGEEGGPTLRVRLLTMPRGPGHADDEFHLSPRVNECVVCARRWRKDPSTVTAEGAGLLRLYVVPRGVRCELPLAAKSYSSHDVVLVCIACHRLADSAAGTLLRQIADALGVRERRGPSVGGTSGAKSSSLAVLRNRALAIIRSRAPVERARDIISQLAEPQVVETARALMMSAEKKAPPETRRHSNRAIKAAAASLAIAAENEHFVQSWSATTKDCNVGSLTPEHVIALARSPMSVKNADDPPTPHLDISAAVVAAVYEGGAAWSRAQSFFSAHSPRQFPASARGVSGLLLSTEGRLELLVRRFRAAFVDACAPRALPSGWAIDYPVFQKGTRTKDKDEAQLAIAALAKGL